MQLDHVALDVANREASAAFYAEYFGLTNRVHDDSTRLIISGAEGGLLALVETGQVGAKPGLGVHFGLRAESPLAVRDLREKFAAAGVEEVEWQEDGLWRVQVRDPDGYLVEAYSY